MSACRFTGLSHKLSRQPNRYKPSHLLSRANCACCWQSEWLRSTKTALAAFERHASDAAAKSDPTNPHCGVAGCPGGPLHAHDPDDWTSTARKELA